MDAVSLDASQVLHKYPHQLSGGQLQRLLIARALLLDIQFLVADEIISMLDASTRIDVLNLLADLKDRGLGILFITHDLSLGNYISERTVILRHGVIVEMGATAKVFGNPQHPYTQMLLASVPQLHRKWAEIEADLLATPTETDGQRRPISHVDTIAAVELDALDSALVEFEATTCASLRCSRQGSGRRHDGNGDVTTPAGKSGAPGVKIAGVGDLPAIPWEDRPAGHSRPVWRYSKNR